MSENGPVDLVKQGERQQELATLLFRDLDQVGWQLGNAFFTQAGAFTAGILSYVDLEGSDQTRPMPAAAILSFVQLRDEMWNPATLPWYHAQGSLYQSGQFQMFFNYERRFDIHRRPLDRVGFSDRPQPSDADLLEDLRRFPRAPEYVPDWYPRVSS